MSRSRLITIVLIGTATLAILYFGYRMVGRQISQPIESELLKADGVKAVSIVKARQGQPKIIKVTPGPAANLAYLYHQIATIAESKALSYEIKVISPPNRDAELLFSKWSLLFYGGLARGDYEAMGAKIKQAAQREGWQIDIQMDDEHVYVAMHKPGSDWYRVVNRYPDPLKEENDS